MIPKINNRGHSFKGVIAYLSHDKGELETAERMSWHETGNMHTDDPEKAARVMAWTDINRDQIRAENGGSASGRKAEAGNVWHFSLSWALGEDPSEAHQRETMHAFLEKHGLSEHEYSLFGHNDTDHVHAHGVVNLVHPETGLVKDIGLDKRRSQQWALDYEREHGIHCKKRVENALKREQGQHTKHQDQKQDYSDKITRAYYASDNGKAFIHALKEEGLELGKARRGDRNYVIVDDRGDIQKLSRQLQIEERGKLKTKAIQALLSDIDRESIKDAEQLSRDIKDRDIKQTMKEPTKQPEVPSPAGNTYSEHWDREQANRDWDESIIDAGIEADAQRQKDRQKQTDKQTDQRHPDLADRHQQWSQNLKDHADQKGHHDKSYARALDGLRDMETRHDRSRLRLEETLKQTYSLGEQERLLTDAQNRAAKADTPLGRMMGRRKSALEDVTAYQKNIANIEERQQEQRGALEAKILTERREAGFEPEPIPTPEIAPKSLSDPSVLENTKDMLEQYEQAAALPDRNLQDINRNRSAKEMLEQYEQAATPGNDNTPISEPQTPQQEQSRDRGGYER